MDMRLRKRMTPFRMVLEPIITAHPQMKIVLINQIRPLHFLYHFIYGLLCGYPPSESIPWMRKMWKDEEDRERAIEFRYLLK